MFEHLNKRVNDKDVNYKKAVEITTEEKQILKGLAAKVAELAARPGEQKKANLWKKHNALERTRPLIFSDPENGWNEIITEEQMQCQNEVARLWEVTLRKDIFWAESMGDDRALESVFEVPHVYSDSGWGLKEEREGGAHGGAFKWKAPIKDYNEDLPKLHFPQITVDHELSQEVLQVAKEIFGGILDVRQKTVWWWSFGLTDELAYLRGMENMLYDFYQHPDKLHELMGILRDGTLARIEYLEKEGLLALNNNDTFVSSGGFGWTDELPQPDFAGKVRTMDMWGFAESQITVGISPQMFEEFIFPYQLPLLDKFGLNGYGCCEPLDKRWHVVERIPRLRRVSVSKWANLPDMVEKLGDKYICSLKPDPVDISTPTIDEKRIREKVKEMLQVTKGCHVELCMKDNHTLGNNPENIIRWCRIAKEEAESLS
ncbi:uroporphyrinogen decarboxylase/cobalamine-independent methonine synthase family protein [Dethiobacter alkaliphilus]|uniref:hypothetical protein n=1 Tax=Dethiobacter alkaliphilus TaxID=427926 RepID=UPI002226FDBD|nr:hypothetical protein [Dethiobacter alkaliphilus]MCW3489991.1 hypothetical protein [Dethiobacter alkaliphilus]